ncbi:MAG: M23 family metallopeptidase [Fibrobacterota bacterium]
MTPKEPVQSAPRSKKYLRYPIPIGIAVLAGFLVKIALFSTAEPVKASVGGPAPSQVADTLRTITCCIQKNENIPQILGLHGVKSSQRFGIVNALQVVYAGGLYEGQEYRLRTAPDSSLAEFILYSRDRMIEYQVSAGDGTFKAGKRQVPLILRTQTLTGALTNSLYAAVTEAGETPELIQNFIDIFAWDINWFVEPRQGDTFKISFEKYYREDGAFIKYGNILAAIYVNGDHAHSAYYFGTGKMAPGYFDENGVSLKKSFLKAPLAYRRISSRFSLSRLHPVLNIRRPHFGIDYAAATGTPVKAAGNGVIASACRNGGYGNLIQIKHPNGYTTCYGHLNGFAKGVRRGKRVAQGDIIGYVGSTGLSTGPHLDYRVTRSGRFVNPLTLKSVPMRRLPKAALPAYAALRESLHRSLDLTTAPTRYASAE